jgi:AraC-like DNA-binding protein
MYITPPFTMHEDICEGPFSLYYIHFHENANGESLFDIFDMPLEIPAAEFDAELIHRMLEINPNRHLRHIDPGIYDNPATLSQSIALHKTIPYHSKIETQGILNQILARFIEKAPVRTAARDSRIENCISHIHANLGRELSVASLAGMACMTQDHFIRLFRRTTGATPLQYINRKRIERAQLLLLTTSKMVHEIAFEVGIGNAAWFNRLFKKTTMLTPKTCRKQQ